MANKALQILQLLLIGPFFALLIFLDRVLYNRKIRNPFLPNGFVRNINELESDPKSFFEWLQENCPEIPRGSKLVKLESQGGAAHEPDKAVLRAKISFIPPGKETPTELDIFVKTPTSRGYAVLFKALISTFTSTFGTKEVQFYHEVWPALNEIARKRGVIKPAAEGELFKVPRHIAACWNRFFERSVLVSHAIDPAFVSRPDHQNAADDTNIPEMMLGHAARLHSLTFDAMTKNSKYQPDNAIFDFKNKYFATETHPVEYLTSVLGLYLPSQPPAAQHMWEAIRERTAHEPSVVAHADFRCGNMLFKFSSSGNSSHASDMAVTDWEANSVNFFAWDPSYALFCSLSPAARKKREKQLLQVYIDEMAARGIKIEFRQLWEGYRICGIMLQYFAWVLKQFGGVGAQQGNSEKDMNSWADKVGDVLACALDDEELPQILRCDPSLVSSFKKGYAEGKILH